MKKIIAITGAKRTGKDTVAEYIRKKLMCSKYAFADEIKVFASLIFKVSDDEMEKRKEEVFEELGISPRQFFTSFGTDFMQLYLSEKYSSFNKIFGRSFWAKRLLEEIKYDNRDVCVVSDLRFLHEYEELKKSELDLITIKVLGKEESIYEENDISEKDLTKIPFDYIIKNDSFVEDLYGMIDDLLISNKEKFLCFWNKKIKQKSS